MGHQSLARMQEATPSKLGLTMAASLKEAPIAPSCAHTGMEYFVMAGQLRTRRRCHFPLAANEPAHVSVLMCRWSKPWSPMKASLNGRKKGPDFV